ncbi:MAG: sulfite exporter TauE/SafE family protein [Candidatus Latescibacterota bacterium]|nr:MAG: sulfite exporter TauE/SafE family protein [Candidatus Latescibacterota bacterium]
MDYLLICLVSLGASALTFFSGFGLGTLLLPAFVLFFPPGISVAMTAVVHLANNIGKFLLIGRHADWSVAARFGGPALAASFVGAWALVWFSKMPPLLVYDVGARELTILPLKIVLSVLMIVFALVELLPQAGRLSFERKYLPLGGALSGFFGGLTGHQGALRSAFLLKCGLAKEHFIATGVVIACVVDLVRITVYGSQFRSELASADIGLLGAAIVCALLGAITGRWLLTKITMRAIQLIVGVMLLLIAIGLGAGLI